jgi:hypothetical protein
VAAVRRRCVGCGFVAAVLAWAPPAAGQTPASTAPDSTLEEWIDALPGGVDAESARETLESAPAWGPSHGALTLAAGARRSARLRGRWRGWSVVGRLSSTEGQAAGGAGGIAWRGGGWLESITIGGLRPRVAEGALVGVRASDYEPARATRGPDGLALRPSASTSGGLLGAGAAVRLGSWRASAGGWRPVRGDDGATGWTSLAHVGSAARMGAALGRVGGAAGSRVPAGSVFAAVGDPALGATVEVARLGDRGSLLARGWSGGEAGAGWCVEAFADGDGAGFGESVVGPDDFRGRRTGAAWHRAVRYGRSSGRVSLYAVSRTRADDRRRRLRAQCEGRLVAARGDRLDWLVRLDDERTLTYDPGGDPPGESALRRARARLRVTVADGPATQRVELTVQAHALERPGVVLGWRGAISWRFLEATVAATTWALPPGETGYYARPGAAGYEILGVATRRGADFSARLSCRLQHGAVTLYRGGRDGGDARWLISLDIRA